MSNESTEFSIRNFIDNRWDDAKIKLSRVDLEFVGKVESAFRAAKLGLVSPSLDSLPTPTTRLSSGWHDLLALSMEVVQEIDRLQLTVSLMNPNNSPDIDRRLTVYYLDVWVQLVFNLCEKLDKLVCNSCRLLLRNKVPDNWREREDHYRDLIKTKVQNEIEKFRSPSVHGAGGVGILAGRVISEEYQAWEISVVVGPHTIDDIIEAAYHPGGSLPPGESSRVMVAKTDFVVLALGTILLELDRELAEASVD